MPSRSAAAVWVSPSCEMVSLITAARRALSSRSSESGRLRSAKTLPVPLVMVLLSPNMVGCPPWQRAVSYRSRLLTGPTAILLFVVFLGRLQASLDPVYVTTGCLNALPRLLLESMQHVNDA